MGDDTWGTSGGGWLSPLVCATEGAVSGGGCSPVLTGDPVSVSHITKSVCHTSGNKGTRDYLSPELVTPFPRTIHKGLKQS